MRVNKSKHDHTKGNFNEALYRRIRAVIAGTDVMNKELFTAFEVELRKFFADQQNQEIRLCFGYSQNFGHRATTVNIMYRLLSYFPADTARTIRVIYDIDAEDPEGPTPEEVKKAFCTVLPKLIPGLTYNTVFGAQPFVLDQSGYPLVTLQFNAYNPRQ